LRRKTSGLSRPSKRDVQKNEKTLLWQEKTITVHKAEGEKRAKDAKERGGSDCPRGRGPEREQ